MLKNSFYRLLYLIVSCVILFLFLGIISMLVASLIVFLKLVFLYLSGRVFLHHFSDLDI
ncbi:Hypothetical protein ETEE_2675 [Edwardsiella anguillarum ET080813]|uniref:Uncharacterized protein n=1 Tax=Edwardsiella anguillarum ET080813 TaxID=667120 RepID=A0A076LU68_9GAMM|nr:Hypothetical protein ETEE_2675 [Edwardsiella anguillarum ET080813]